MVTQGEAVGNLPPVLGTINVQVTTKRPDLQSVLGHVARVPRAFDAAAAEGSSRVWVHHPGFDLSGEGPFAFPTIVLTADELRMIQDEGPEECHSSRRVRDAV